MDESVRIQVIILGNSSLICCIILALAYINNPSFRKPPGNLAMWQFIFQAIFSLHWLTPIPKIYQLLQGLPCLIVSIVTFYSQMVSWNYLICTQLQIYIAIKSMKPYNPRRNTLWHLISNLGALILTFFMTYITVNSQLQNTCSPIDICFFYSNQSCLWVSILMLLSIPLCVGLLIFSCYMRGANALSRKYKQFQKITLAALISVFPACATFIIKTVFPIPWPDLAQIVMASQIIIALVASWGVFNFIGRVYNWGLFVKVIKAAFCLKKKPRCNSNSYISLQQNTRSSLSLYPAFQSVIAVVKSKQNILNMLNAFEILFKPPAENMKIKFKDKFHKRWKFKLENNTEVKITEYNWEIFENLRENDGVSNQQLIEAFVDCRNYTRIEESAKNPGGRGFGFMFFTANKRFILKTLNASGMVKLEQFIEQYSKRVFSNKTLISRLYGAFLMKLKNLDYYVVILQNILFSVPNALVFDLKGSQKDRRVTSTVYQSIQEIPNVKVYKDIDFINFVESIKMNQKERLKLIRLIQSDARLLSDINVMDYSLLLGISTVQEELEDQRTWKYRFQGWIYRRKYVFYVSIIDFFQEYNIQKKLERQYKGIKAQKSILSVQPPEEYYQRFIKKASLWFKS